MRDCYLGLVKQDTEDRTKVEAVEAKARALVDLVPNLEAWVKLLEIELEASRDSIKELED